MKQMITVSKTARAITVIGYCSLTIGYCLLFIGHCLLVIVLAVVLAACSGDGSEMRAQLEELERQNLADSLMKNDSLAEQLVRYFDRHGTPNERMRAYYILGRTYADMGEAPAALETYLEAANCADTTQADCDYAKLSRIHAQSANIYYEQLQARSLLEELRLAGYYAKKGQDTLMAIETFSQTANAYSLLQMPDSVIDIRMKASQMYDSIGYVKRSATALGGAISPSIDCSRLEEAQRFINVYETYSGHFDKEGKIDKGRELYYYVKGRYYIAIHQIDSALIMFRLLSNVGYTIDHKIAACKGLQEVYEKLKTPDSIAKYANLGYQLNDSAYSLSEMENIQRLKASYNYNRNKLLAEENESEANRLRYLLILIISVSSIILLVASILFLRHQKKQQKRLFQYQCDLERLGRAQAELMQALGSDDREPIDDVVHRKELERIENAVMIQRKTFNLDHAKVDQQLRDSAVVQRLRDILALHPQERASLADMKDVQSIVNEYIPTFFATLNPPGRPMNPSQYEICLLIRVFFTPAEIARLLGRSDSYVAITRKRILAKVYGIDGPAKELDARIQSVY